MSLSHANQLYLAAQAAFISDDFAAARQYIVDLEKLNWDFATVDAQKLSPSRVSLAIVSYKSLDETRRLVRNIAELASDVDYHFILVSNADLDLFPYAASELGNNYTNIVMGANFGASLGRNAAINFCKSDAIVFIDDDGVTDPYSVRKLVSTMDKFGAAAVRGRVVPLTEGTVVPKHYDVEQHVLPRFMDIEGMTIWRTSALRNQQFDPLLYGHEGIELTGRLYTNYGRDAFIYEPDAVLQHDFAVSETDAAVKTERMERNDRYIAQKQPDLQKIKNIFYKASGEASASAALLQRAKLASLPSSSNSRTISFVTTCFNGAEFIKEYADSLKAQTSQNFEIVFVDDGSDDGSLDLLKHEFQGDDRLKAYRTDHLGRAGALNFAISKLNTSYALIADADDISVPTRVEWTLNAYEAWPSADAIGFGIFDINTAARAARPIPSKPVPLEVRRFFGMPSPFPGFSFKVSSFSEPFDESLKAGIDCDWINRNFTSGGLKGWFVPVSLVFYRLHSGQITATKRDLQRSVALSCVKSLHESYLGELNDNEYGAMELFTGWNSIGTGPLLHRMKHYGDRLVMAVSDRNPELASVLMEEVECHVNERHLNLAKNDYKRANAKRQDLDAAVKKQSSELLAVSSKLRWNRKRVGTLEAQARNLDDMARKHSSKLAVVTSKLTWNRERVLILEDRTRYLESKIQVLVQDFDDTVQRQSGRLTELTNKLMWNRERVRDLEGEAQELERRVAALHVENVKLSAAWWRLGRRRTIR